MKHREWTVGLLSELHPHKDPTLLGLNKNAGEAIHLRILTDDLTGLRSVSDTSSPLVFHPLMTVSLNNQILKYAHTRMVLLHELTHNKHRDHDQSFKTLNSLLNKEVKAYEAAKRAGTHRLGGEIHDVYDGEEEQVEQMCGSVDHGGVSASSNRSGGGGGKQFRKNGKEEGDGLWEMEQRRQAILKAAEERSRKQS